MEPKASVERAKLAIIPMCERMNPSSIWLQRPHRASLRAWLVACACVLGLSFTSGISAQDNPLDKVHVPPPATTAPGTGAPAGVDAPAATGAGRAKPGSLIRMNVDMVLVPITVTDPMNRLVTGLEQEDFQVYENSGEQKIRSFASGRCAGVDRHHF